MRINMLQRNKRGVSIILSYVLLITLGVALSTLVFIWLRDYVTPDDAGKCPEDVSLIIESVVCNSDKGKFKINLTNKGLFNINGNVIRVNDREGKLGIYELKDEVSAVFNGGGDWRNFSEVLNPGKKVELIYDFSSIKNSKGNKLSKIKVVDVQPFIIEENKVVYCERVSNVDVDCGLSIVSLTGCVRNVDGGYPEGLVSCYDIMYETNCNKINNYGANCIWDFFEEVEGCWGDILDFNCEDITDSMDCVNTKSKCIWNPE